MNTQDSTPEPDSTNSTFVLPSDALGRVACVIIGAFFGVAGGSLLGMLIANRRILDAIVWYELSVCTLLFGVCLFVWGLLAPRWLERIVSGMGTHFFFLVAALFLPFVIEAILVLMQGNV